MKAPEDPDFAARHVRWYADMLRLRDANAKYRLVGVQVVVPLPEPDPTTYEWDDSE